MPVEGDLKDISLISIMQMVCLERRNAGLFITRRGEEAAVFFSDGEIVHATLGALRGEDAVYQLITWKDGFFRMSDQEGVPHKTIGKSWNSLLLEGMKRIDEQQHAAGIVATPAPAVRQVSRADTVHDEGLEFELITLLSNLEQTLARLDDKKMQKQPSLFVQALAEMVNQVAAAAMQLQEAEARRASLAQFINEAGDVYPAVRLLLVQSNRLSTKMVENLDNARATSLNVQRPSLRQVCQGLILVLQSYFSLFEQCYRTANLREQWGETYNVFLVEIKRALAKAPF